MTTGDKTLHIVEPGGRGGVYQHVLGAIQNDQFRDYDRIVLHTAKDAELTPDLPNLSYCFCMRYERRGKRPFRASVSLAWVGACLLPHLFLTAAKSRADWEIQGLFGKGVYAALVGMPRLFGRKTTFVPHNSFSRSGNKVEAAAMAVATRMASETVAFVESERDKFAGARVTLRRLWQYLAEASDLDKQFWAERLRGAADKPVVTFIGQLRQDKNPIMLLEAAGKIDAPLTLVFAGQDKGAVRAIREYPLAPQHQRIIVDRYLTMGEFQSIILASDLIACPYAIASQSGVISVASQLGKPVLASQVGGLAEQASHSFDASGDDPAGALASALASCLGVPA